MLPPQSARPDWGPGADRQAAPGPRDRGARGTRHARATGSTHHVRPIALRNHHLRSTGHAGGTRADVVKSSLILLAMAACLFAQSPPNWDRWQFLIGDWVGEGGGEPGQGAGAFSFRLDLEGRVLVRKNRSDYPEAKDR